MIKKGLLLIGVWFLFGAPAQAFDHSHQVWDLLLRTHVHWDRQGVASQVDYTGIKQQEVQLDSYLADLSAVPLKTYMGWEKPVQLAFLLNAYNAFTVKLILSQYPDLASIKDLGSIFSSPWKIKFIHLLGKQRHLDEIEHAMIRQKGAFDDPRIHSAVVCASIGCPGIRNEAFVAGKIEAQLEDSMRRFLSDRSRNRYNAAENRLEISKIFDWYADDFVSFRGHQSVSAFLGDYAQQLGADAAAQELIRSGAVELKFLDYDWRLNDYRK